MKNSLNGILVLYTRFVFPFFCLSLLLACNTSHQRIHVSSPEADSISNTDKKEEAGLDSIKNTDADNGEDADVNNGEDADIDNGEDADIDNDNEERPVIMLTGFWSPTGLMVRQFSQDNSLNPDGWMGENWENRGYDVISFFPDPRNDAYTGDFEVDYQDVSEDFWRYTNLLTPIAIISFGRGASYRTPWKIEYNARNLTDWVRDRNAPYLPTPNPPEGTAKVNLVRNSTLPVQKIADEINTLNLPNIGTGGAAVNWNGNPGAYLCEFMAYHGMWYQNLYENSSTRPCFMAGFIHVHRSVSVNSGKLAVEETLRVVIEALDRP